MRETGCFPHAWLLLRDEVEDVGWAERDAGAREPAHDDAEHGALRRRLRSKRKWQRARLPSNR